MRCDSAECGTCHTLHTCCYVRVICVAHSRSWTTALMWGGWVHRAAFPHQHDVGGSSAGCAGGHAPTLRARELRDGDANLGGRHHRFADLVVGTVVNSIYNRCLSSVASDQSITRFRYVVCERARTIERSGMNSELSLDLVLAARDTDWRHRLATPATDPSSNYLTGN